ncbi:MAG: ribonuclease E/G [Butyribacter sp.]|nr:ribonuclease E/G [bacterium]MDY3853493.1 ribonuclease E/G [Butyribacter sp.]
MKNQLLITQNEGYIVTVWVEENQIQQIQAQPLEEEEILGNIYVGKVRNIVKNINAAFVEFQKGQMGYLSLRDDCCPIHTNGTGQNTDRVLIGDEIIVQVEKEAVKTKPPTLTGRLDFTGKYMILTAGKSQISISKKIKSKESRKKLHQLIEESGVTKEYGWIARTNSMTASASDIKAEMEQLKEQYRKIVKQGMHRNIFTCLYQAPASYLANIKDMYQERIHEVITDSDAVYAKIKEYLEEQQWETQPDVSLWDEKNGKLDAVYNISTTMKKALQEKVWLKHGGYLIIQPTEALVSIDVNTGKSISKKKEVQTHFLKVNMEAAAEIAHQLRLRNLSGMILVDFIDMTSQEANQELMAFFKKELKKDPVPTELVDMTKLGLIEVTRKKVRKPLYEQMQRNHGR